MKISDKDVFTLSPESCNCHLVDLHAPVTGRAHPTIRVWFYHNIFKESLSGVSSVTNGVQCQTFPRYAMHRKERQTINMYHVSGVLLRWLFKLYQLERLLSAETDGFVTWW
jgi:hypothetical protein